MIAALAAHDLQAHQSDCKWTAVSFSQVLLITMLTFPHHRQ
jgi:hypothetical protein